MINVHDSVYHSTPWNDFYRRSSRRPVEGKLLSDAAMEKYLLIRNLRENRHFLFVCVPLKLERKSALNFIFWDPLKNAINIETIVVAWPYRAFQRAFARQNELNSIMHHATRVSH